MTPSPDLEEPASHQDSPPAQIRVGLPQSADAHDSARVFQAGRDQIIVERDLVLIKEVAYSPSADASTPFDDVSDPRSRPIFLQHVNPEVLACYNVRIGLDDNLQMLAAAARACRLIVLLTDAHLTLPASCLFEVPNFRLFIDRVYPLVCQGILRYVASVPDLTGYRDSKVTEYRRDITNPYTLNRREDVAWMNRMVGAARQSSTTAVDLGNDWMRAIEPGGALFAVRMSASSRWRGRRSRFTKLFQGTPARLDGQAFIGRFVRQVLPIDLQEAEQTRLDLFLSQAYLRSYLADLDANLVVDFPYGELSCGLHTDMPGVAQRLLSFGALSAILRLSGVSRFVKSVASWDEILALRNAPELALLSLFALKPVNLTRVRLAAVRADRDHQLHEAEDLTDAVGNLRRMVDGMVS